MSVRVKFISEVEVKDEKKVLKAAKNARVKINDSCEGKGKCGKCVIKVIDGKLSEPTKEELKILGKEKIDGGYRLACQTRILEDSVIEIIDSEDAKAKRDAKCGTLKVKDSDKIKLRKEDIDTNDKVEASQIEEVKIKIDSDDNKLNHKEHNKDKVKKNKKSDK
ncbi:hypothetical protein C1H57_16445 [Clostridium sp. 2-1]|uniref:2Fe-2S iron-sulfur cluster-binding protein n=1 Tax=Clostridium TaxID=1485 RepID=UPI000CDAC5D6|nr:MULTISPECIES: 2Fe-2S iron-sulfur cluster binding domain-containing protein [Clostridium]MBN7576633.1 2Fe-2S iron-sulfur cluster binding domain-containing protein [Clostridium beijerinckii]MBN7577331.1 2Fe-2S iron-sulfur cluster binding domain-containing protein [Clostridium beijerinckii]MBN7586390.1 2Fe-2S iron-sulfur cluster binding domain-containing protein [Clostridium beijerinckii]MBO0522370.1 2Fe-2S iron-sulfur cluster binding domain-containing protein [Clostridium beijerinckii]POO9025